MSRIKLAKKLIKDGKDHYYVSEGKKRIYNSIVKTSELIKGGEKLLDIGGHPHTGIGYSFEEYTKILCDVEYSWVNRQSLDMRTEKLKYEDNTFDIVVSHETIEHFWLMKEGGMLSWDGIINFWKESYRVLKPGGIFYVSTRNRVCPYALLKILTNDFVQCSWPSVNISGHVNEICIKDIRDIVGYTGLFNGHMVTSSTSSFSRSTQIHIDKQTPALEKFLGRKFKQEEMYDTMHFISKKNK